MSHINLREEKERDFLLAYEEELKELGEDAPFVPRDEIIFRTLHSGRGRFYVSFEEAARQVKRIYNRRPLKCRNQRKVAMYQELARLVAEYRMRKPGASFRDALFTVLAEAKASRFFFGVQTGRLILYRRQRCAVCCCNRIGRFVFLLFFPEAHGGTLSGRKL